MTRLYDRADIYDLMESENRYQFFKEHWESILAGRSIRTLLDVSIDSGSVTIPLLDLGVKLFGSDLSKEMLERCEKKIAAKGDTADLRICDFRELHRNFTERFDCVASTGNSLAYVTNEELLTVLERMDERILPGGYLYFDMRNWDHIVKIKQRFYTYNPFFDGDTRINLVQCWDHNTDETIDFNLLYTFEKNNRIFQKEIFREHYYPVPQKLLIDKLKTMGYSQIEIRRFPIQAGEYTEECDWYCVVARKPMCVTAV